MSKSRKPLRFYVVSGIEAGATRWIAAQNQKVLAMSTHHTTEAGCKQSLNAFIRRIAEVDFTIAEELPPALAKALKAVERFVAKKAQPARPSSTKPRSAQPSRAKVGKTGIIDQNLPKVKARTPRPRRSK